jgi:uncharacterized membrane protein HdeD (DUF308 family)
VTQKASLGWPGMGRLDEREAVESSPSRTSTGWPFVILGVAAVAVGLLMMLYGRETIGTIILFFAAALGVWGLRQIVAAFGAAEPTDRAIRLFFGFAAVAGATIFCSAPRSVCRSFVYWPAARWLSGEPWTPPSPSFARAAAGG